MDGKFPSLGANSEQSHGLAENTHCEHHVLDNTNDFSSTCGKIVSEENYSKKWDGDVANASPESLHCQGEVARMQEIPPEVASLSTSYASMAYSPDCQQIPSETTPEPIKKSNFPAYQHPSMEDLRDIPDGYIGRKESVTNIYNSVNDQLPAAQKENVNSDNPVTKETFEMNNEMELVQDLLVDVCKSPLIHVPSTESRAVDFAKSNDPVDNEIHEKERRQTTEAQESAVIILSDDTKKFPFVPNQDFQQKTVMEFVDPLIDGLSLNVKVLSETSCGMHKDSSSVGLHDATEVCSLTQDSYSTINPIRSNMHEQCNGYISCASLTMSNSSGNDESVLRQVVQHSSHRTSSELAQSFKNVSTGKCMEIQTKNCTDNNATLHKCLPGQHLKVDTEPNSASTSHKEQRLVCNLQNGNVPTINSLGSQTPVEISNNCIEIEESNLSSGQKVVEKKETGVSFMPDDKLPCSQNHCSFEPASSDANNTSLMTSNTDHETDTGQIITLNIMNVGTVSDDTPAHYVSQGQSQSLTDSSNPEAKVNRVSSLENTSKEITSEVNFGTPQTPTDFLETETAHVEPCKNLSALFVQPECKIDPDFKSSFANLSNVSTSVRIKKRVGLSFKKRKLLKMANAFSTTRETLETAQGLQEHRFRKISRDLKKIPVKAKKQQSPPLVEKRRKSNKKHIGQAFSASSGSQANHIQKALKTEEHNEKHENGPRSSMKDLHSNPSNTLLKMPSESQHNDTDLTQSRKQISCEKQNKMRCLRTEINSDDSFELSLQSTVNSTGFRSRITNAFSKTVKNRRSRKMDVSLKASDQHPGELSVKDVGNKNPVCETNALSPIRKIDRSTQYSDEDYATALNNDTRTVAHAVKSTKVTKNYISCKYCCRSFRHISAYTVHQRIHTGEKPYRCECCGKNFAQLSKLKSHRNVHFRSVLLPCPCCGKELSEKRDLMAHFMTHVKASKWNNEPSQEGNKPDAPIMGPTHSKRIICNVYDNKFPTGYLRKFHKHACDKLMSCKTCGQEFQTSSQLVAHKKTHWPVKPYACSICAKGFDRLNALKKHSERHTGDRPFSCSHCHRAFGDLPALRLHQLSKLCNPKPPLNGDDCDLEGFLISNGVDSHVNTPMFFKCQICKGHYQKWCQYTLHLQTHTKSPSYLCFACGQSYEKDSVVDVHCRVCCQTSGEEVACGSLLSESLHSDSRKCTSLKDSPPADLYTVEAPNGNSLSSAGQLHKNSQTPSNLQRDLMPESSQLTRASTLSGNVSHDSHLPSSPTPSVMTCVSLNESQECVISPRLWSFKCPRCGQRYKRYRALCLHMQTHAPTFKYVCGPCGHSFERWNKLWLHQKIHRRKGQGYTCSQCNVRFHFFSSYRMHMLNHSEERPYTCPLCCQTFARELDLHVHQCSLQQPSRKLQCDVCSRTFSNSTNLLKHNLLHNGAISHQCLQCNLSFPNNKSLHEHLNTHSSCVSLLPPLPSEPFTFLHNCNRCKSSFSTGDLLFAHQICHTRKLKSRVHSTQSHESTSGALGGTRSSTNRSLLSTLDLDAIPKETLFKYPHPDKLYIPSHLSITSKRVPVINLVSADEDLSQEGSIGPSEQECPKISQENSENKFKNQPQVLESQGWSENFQDTPSHNSPTQFAETSVLLEGPAATVNTAENEIQGEIFECADCSEKLGTRRELFEHYFLHALGDTHL